MNPLNSASWATSRATNGSITSPARNQADGQTTLANRLTERLGLVPGSLTGKGQEDFSPDKVAERVLGFVEQGLQSAQASGADSSKLQSILQQTRKGVEQGFSEARKILDDMGLLNGQVASDIDSTYEKIQNGFSALDQRYNPGTSSAGSISLSSQSQRFIAKAESFQLEVTTRDGDRLRIAIAQASASWSQSKVAASSDGSTSALLASSQSGSVQIGAWQVDIQGELDDQERGALEKLFGQVQDLADKFYSGDLNGAFDRAMALDLDGEQLASMSLALSQTTVRQATETYSTVAQQGGQAASAFNGALFDYAQSLLDSLRSSQQVAAPEDAKSMLEQLLEGGFSLDDRFSDDSRAQAGKLNSRLLDGWQALLGGAPGSSARPLA
ncbi:DUF5610 domain-containing protein [Pseudomonas sp. 5P_3.1_Bac2]|uniref:DUF5610 domain-containing protein n=1 Tax=Pseudomonas sp. 5P_3.1_Bac2 TaxID=2971617 RepID=UPI0021C7AE66|nr:DUF5610 domain-containing protein [Pseudomonas sp. 5P_3.1_Bac2]MCU1716555.1 DUF5610 domain-containing protein [Pseudomonas sp. 5P_3.1_Bac2]